ncbi:hypothetical protein KBD45_04180 [Candidatus Dojkabacteria bacterium]|nr:hypothetical protein [Candidatus Dojkabacteria bacterium]
MSIESSAPPAGNSNVIINFQTATVISPRSDSDSYHLMVWNELIFDQNKPTNTNITYTIKNVSGGTFRTNILIADQVIAETTHDISSINIFNLVAYLKFGHIILINRLS